jgi:predicted ATPase
VHRHAGDVAWFSFGELCAPAPGGRPLGASDYHAVALAFRHIFVAGVPVLSKKERNEARRLVLLIDSLYEARCAVHIAAAAPLDKLLAPLLAASLDDDQMMGGAEVAVDEAGQHSLPFQAAAVGGRYSQDGELAAFFTAKDEVFMMRRTRSRLMEMCRPAGGS